MAMGGLYIQQRPPHSHVHTALHPVAYVSCPKGEHDMKRWTWRGCEASVSAMSSSTASDVAKQLCVPDGALEYFKCFQRMLNARSGITLSFYY
eukprot:scaffold36223_cov62-Attheya_sp.AAC.4